MIKTACLQSYNQLVVTWYTAVRLWFWLRLFLPRNQEGYTFVPRSRRRGPRPDTGDKTGFLGPPTEYKKSQDPQSLARVHPLPSIRERLFFAFARRPFIKFARRMSGFLQNS